MGSIGEVGRYGIGIISAINLNSKFSVKVGLYHDEYIKPLADSGILPLVPTAEAYAFGKTENEYVLAGYDEKGLLYGCQELAERLGAGEDINEMCFSGKPFLKTRGIYTFLHNRDLEEEWFYNPNYWIQFFDEMSRNRYNSFNLVFSHQTSYLVPMFAYFLEVTGFGEIHPTDADARQIRKNHEMLQFISRQAVKRGIDFIIGIWQVSPWKNRQNCAVAGITPENLKPFTYHAMKQLIAEFPAIRGLQIRANSESGIAKEEQTDFFTNTLFKAMAEADRPFIFDFRCWLAEPETIENALKMVPGTRLSCKYWAEFLGAPYQPAKINPGYSYSNFLKQPLKTDFIYQVWNLGSPRLLLWADPDYVRRFVFSCTLGGGTGFEMNPHLAQKGYGNAPGHWRIFKNPDDEYFIYEHERYWLTRLLFGRLGYNPDCGKETWMRPLQARFGDAAEMVLDLYRAGSDIITFLIQYQLSDYNMYIWPEIDTGGLLDFYMVCGGSDKCVVDITENYVNGLLRDEPSGLFSPPETAARFRDKAAETLTAAAALEKIKEPSKELLSTIRDFKILAYLGMYHSIKTMAAVSLKFYYKTLELSHLRESYQKIRQATIYWEQIISITKDYYYGEMVTGPNDAGSWMTKLLLVYEDEIRVAELLRIAEQFGGNILAFDFGALADKQIPCKAWSPKEVCKYYSIERGFSHADGETAYSAEKGYGWESGTVFDIAMPPVRLKDLEFDPYRRDTWKKVPVEKCKGFRNALLEDGVYGSGPAVFRCDLPEGEYEVTVVIADQTENARVHGPMSVDIGGAETGEFTVMPLEEYHKKAVIAAGGGIVRIKFDSRENADWFVSGIVVKPLTPVIYATPFTLLSTDNAVMYATISSPDGIANAAVTVDGTAPVPLRLIRGNEYCADLSCILPFGKKNRVGAAVYAESKTGKTSNIDTVLLLRDRQSYIRVHHIPITGCRAGSDIIVKAVIDSAYPLRKAILHYSYVNQFEKMRDIDFASNGSEYSAVIPGSCIVPEWDMLYYFEFTDETGSGIIYPDFREQTPYWVINTRAT